MKTKILLAAAVAAMVSTKSNAQTWSGTTTTGSCTIGSTLFLKGGMVDMFMPTDSWRTIAANSWAAGLNLMAGNDGTNTGISLYSKGAPTNPGQVRFISAAPCSLTCDDIAYEFLNNTSLTTWDELLRIKRNGNVTTYGSIDMMQLAPGDNKRGIYAHSVNGGLNILSGSTGGGNGAGMVLNAPYEPTDPGQVRLIANTYQSRWHNPATYGNTLAYNFMTFDGFDDLGAPGSYKTEMAILSNGNVSIGTATPGEKLNVEGNISFNGSNAIRIIKGQTDKYLQILSAWGYSGGSGIELHTDLDYGKGRISFVAGGNSSTDNAYEFMQYNGGANSGNMVILKDGRVLIGLGGYDAGVPMQKLTVDGDIALTRRNNPDGYRSILGTSDNYGLNLLAGIDGSNTGIRLFSKNNTSDSSHRGQIQFSSSVSTSGNDAYAFLNNGAAGYEALMLIKQDGKVTIGKDIVGKTPDGYNLYVSKGILTEKLKVANSGDAPNWYDFVFESDYDLMPLDKVEAYVKTNKHLPEIPSASEVAKDGIDVMEMDGKLLQKIEELTLYVIQQQKEIDLLKKQLKPNR